MKKILLLTLLMLLSITMFGQLRHIGSYVIDGTSCDHTNGDILDIPITIYSETDSTVTLIDPRTGANQVSTIVSIIEVSENAYGYTLETTLSTGETIATKFVRIGTIAIALVIQGEVRFYYFQGKWPSAPSKVKKQQS